MNQDASDLAALSRARSSATPKKTDVPPPKRRWRTRVALPGVIVLATIGLLGYAAGEAIRPATPVDVVPVIVKTDVSGAPEGSVVVQAPGWVEADPFPTAVSALADGIVEDMLVLEGDRIEEGQIVARLIDEDARIALQHAEAMLAQMRAEQIAAEAALEAAQRNWDHPIELTRRLATTEAQLAEKRAELARWPAEVNREEAEAVYFDAEYQRLQPLLESGQAADIEVIEARQANEMHKAAVEVIKHRKPILEAQIRSLEAEAQAAREDMRLRIHDTRRLAEAKATLQRAKAAVAVAEAKRDEAALRLARMEVRSPADGVVMERLAEPGAKLILNMDTSHSAHVVHLYDPDELQVRVDIPLVEAAKVGVGQRAEVIVDVLPDRAFGGVVTRIVHQADVQKNTLQVKVAIEDPSSEIKPEMLARARFFAAASPEPDESAKLERLFIPQRAVHDKDGNAWVWLADQETNLARRVSIEPGRGRVGESVEVAGGLQVGDRVIVDPPSDLEEAQRIRINEVN